MNIRRMDSHGGWIATATDLARFIVRIDRNNSKPDLISKDNLNELYFGYNNWYFYGSLPGTSAVLSRYNDNFSFAVLVNTRTESNIDLILDGLYNTVKEQIDSNPANSWPDDDLF